MEKQEKILTNKELKRLKRRDLLELLLEQSKEKDALTRQLEEKDKMIEELQVKLENKDIDIQEAGTIAEASFKLNGVLEAAEKAAKQYLDNLRQLSEKEEYLYTVKEKEVEERCKDVLSKTTQQCEEYLKMTELKCQQREREAEEKCRDYDRASHEGLRELLASLKI